MNKIKINHNLIKYLFALVLFGTNGVATRGLSLHGYEIALMRAGIGCLVLTIIFFIKREKVLFLSYKSDLIGLILSGVFLGLGWIFLFEGYDAIGVSLTVLLYYTGPAMMMILSPFLYKEKMTVAKVVGFLIVVVGICLVNGISSSEPKNFHGILLGFLSGLTYTGLLITNRMIKHVKGIESTCFQLFFAFVAILIYKICKAGITINIRQEDLPQIIYLGVVCTAIGCYCYYSTINILPVTTVCICGYLDPVSALVFSYIFLHESFSVYKVLGAIMIVMGVLITELYEYYASIRRIKNNLLNNG